jgi:hypothetical protein
VSLALDSNSTPYRVEAPALSIELAMPEGTTTWVETCWFLYLDRKAAEANERRRSNR